MIFWFLISDHPYKIPAQYYSVFELIAFGCPGVIATKRNRWWETKEEEEYIRSGIGSCLPA
jgi:hypothetical protein